MPKQPPPPPPPPGEALEEGFKTLVPSSFLWRNESIHTCIVVPCTILGIGMKCVFCGKCISVVNIS